MADAPKRKGGLKLGAKVWVRDVDIHNPDVFVMATLKGLSGNLAKVQTDKGDLIDTDVFYPANPPNQSHSDHTGLLFLSDATLLANTKIRYANDDIYTFVGPILISVCTDHTRHLASLPDCSTRSGDVSLADAGQPIQIYRASLLARAHGTVPRLCTRPPRTTRTHILNGRSGVQTDGQVEVVAVDRGVRRVRRRQDRGEQAVHELSRLASLRI